MGTQRKASRRTFGAVKRQRSGRHQASYLDPITGRRRIAPDTFTTKKAADDWLAGIQADIARQVWRSPDAGNVTLHDYIGKWLGSRVDLAPSTRELYESLDRQWINAPIGGVNIGAVELRHLTTPLIREWHAGATRQSRAQALARIDSTNRRHLGHPARAWARREGIDVPATGKLRQALLTAWKEAGSPEHPRPPLDPVASPPGSARIQQAYRLVHAALAQAVEDGLLTVNPCRVKGASAHRSPERPPATPGEVSVIAANMPPRYAAAVVAAAWSGLRAGELFGLARRHIDLDSGTVRVERQLGPHGRGFAATKNKQARTVHLPELVVEQLRGHLAEFTAARPDALVFATDSGQPVHAANRQKMWQRARRAAGREDLRWHDLRATGATFAAQSGASLREVQARLGHSTVSAAMLYQRAAEERDRLIAARMNEAIAEAANVIPLRSLG